MVRSENSAPHSTVSKPMSPSSSSPDAAGDTVYDQDMGEPEMGGEDGDGHGHAPKAVRSQGIDGRRANIGGRGEGGLSAFTGGIGLASFVALKSDSIVTGAANWASSYSLILPRAFAESAWARTILGPFGLITWVLGFMLGFVDGVMTGFSMIPASITLLIAIMVLGLLDAMGGLLAWLTITLGALLTGHIRDWNDVRTSLGLAFLVIALPLLATFFRPLRRAPGNGFVALFDRFADYIVGPVLVAFAAAAIAKAMNGLSGLEIVAAGDIVTIQVAAVIAVVARMILEDVAIRRFPNRWVEVQLPASSGPSRPWRIVAIVGRTLVIVLIMVPFIGLTWVTWAFAIALAIPMLLKLWQSSLPNIPWLYKFLPRGLFKLSVMLVVGTFVAAWVFKSENLAVYLPGLLVVLLVPSLIYQVLELFARSGPDWKFVWEKRLCGVVIWVFMLGMMFGFITLVH